MSDTIEIRTIRTDGGTQPRAGLDDKTVADYADEIRQGAKFPPVVLFFDGSHYWLADGFHRVAAAKFSGKQRILAEIHQGTLRDAQLYAVGANATHGLRRSREDKRRAVEMLLSDQEWGQWADREIARRCKVSNTFVGNIRKEMSLTVNVDSDNGRKYVTKHGTEAVMSVNGDGSNVDIDQDLTAVLRSYLEKEYKTTEPASLAVLARALSARVEHCVTIQSRLKLFKAGPYGVQAALIALAQELQSYVPQKQNDQATQPIPSLLRLAGAVKQLCIEDVVSIRRWNNIEIKRIERHPDADRLQQLKHYYQTLEELICDLRPS